MKRLFDFTTALLGIVFFAVPLLVAYVVASIDTQSSGIFTQKRVGQYGKLFTIYKLKTVHPKTRNISKIGVFLRKYKFDELPQFFNVLIGNMSIVGPRPDIPGYYDLLKGEDRKILQLKPGITSEASIKYYNEEEILKSQSNQLEFNDTVIFPDKVRINLEYQKKQSFLTDLKIIYNTLFQKKQT